MAPGLVITVRRGSTLVEKLRTAVSTPLQTAPTASWRQKGQQDVPEASPTGGEHYNELFVMPKRKLRGQVQIEQATGRAAVFKRSRTDINDRLSVRPDRSAEMQPDETDWPSVWPAARTFAASVVPLPVRMGTRPDPEKRAPFQKHGNLELVKIPNFLHLTPTAVEKHCEALKQFCTQFPAELEDAAVLAEHFPVSFEYSDYVHQGVNIRDPRARVVTMRLKVASLGLDEHGREKLIRLAGRKYEEETDTLTIVTDRCHTRKQNTDYANYLLTVLYHESNKQEAWEKMRERRDNLKVEFSGSKCQEELLKVLEADGRRPAPSDDKIAAFEAMWTDYRNQEETPEATRNYAEQMKQLLGIRPVS